MAQAGTIARVSAGPAWRACRGRPPLGLLALAALVALLALSPGAAWSRDASLDRPRTVSLTAIGQAYGTPDVAILTFGIVNEDASADRARVANAAAAERMLATLTGLGIAADAVRVLDLSLHARFQVSSDGRSSAVSGFRASRLLRVRVADLARLGAVFDAIVADPASQVGGVEFAVADFEAVLANARRRAMANAESAAALYAEATGTKVGRVLSVIEESLPASRPAPRSALDSKAASSPGEPARDSIEIRVNVTWELE